MNVARLRPMKQPRRRATAIAGASVACLAFASGCSGKYELNLPDDRTWESAHFRYHSRSDDDNACSGVVEQLERNFELTQAYLGFTWPLGRKVDYFKFRDSADYLINSECPADSSSCTNGSTIQSPDTLEEHELIHAYLAPLGHPPAFFSEGIASALACEAPGTKLVSPKAWRDVVSLPLSDRFHVYLEGEWFTGYLLARFGPDPFLSLYGNLHDASASSEQIAVAFESVYNQTLDSVWNAGLGSGYTSQCVNLWKCNGPSMQLDGSPQTFFQACDGSDNTRTFELSAETDLLMSVDDRFVYAPVRCSQGVPAANTGDAIGAVVESTVVPMTPGRYFMQGVGHKSAAIGVRALPEKAYSRDCTHLDAFELNVSDFPHRTFKLTVPNDGAQWFTKLRPTGKHSLWWVQDEEQKIRVEQCVISGSSPDCKPLLEEAQPDTDGNVILRLTSVIEGSGYSTTDFQF